MDILIFEPKLALLPYLLLWGSEFDQEKHGPVSINSCTIFSNIQLTMNTAWLAKELRHCPESLSNCLESQVKICHDYT